MSIHVTWVMSELSSALAKSTSQIGFSEEEVSRALGAILGGEA
jgi:hypothetical protein